MTGIALYRHRFSRLYLLQTVSKCKLESDIMRTFEQINLVLRRA